MVSDEAAGGVIVTTILVVVEPTPKQDETRGVNAIASDTLACRSAALPRTET